MLLYTHIIDLIHEGLAIEGIVFSAGTGTDTGFGTSGTNTTFTISWTIGTDVLYEVDFGDGSDPHEWNWQTEGHVLS